MSRPKNEPTRAVKISERLWKRMKKLAKEKQIFVTTLVDNAIENYLRLRKA